VSGTGTQAPVTESAGQRLEARLSRCRARQPPHWRPPLERDKRTLCGVPDVAARVRRNGELCSREYRSGFTFDLPRNDATPLIEAPPVPEVEPVSSEEHS